MGGIGIEFREDEDAGRGLLGEGEVFAGGAKAEVGVEFGTIDRTIFSGGENNEVGEGTEGGIGETPFGEVGGVVGEIVISEDGGGSAGVVDFNPVGGVAVFIGV